MSQSQVQGSGACARVLAGDTSSICDLTETDILSSGHALLTPLAQAVQRSESPQIEAKAAALLTLLGGRCEVNAFVSIVRILLDRLRTVSCSHDWVQLDGAQIARFYAANLVNLLRGNSHALVIFHDALRTYLAIFSFAMGTLSASAASNLYQTVVQRLDHVIGNLFRVADNDTRCQWIQSFQHIAPTPDVSVGLFHAKCAMLRGASAHSCRSLGLGFLEAALIWLPGMDVCLGGGSSPLAKVVFSFARQLPDGFFAAGEPSGADVPPWLRWWQMGFKVVFAQQASGELIALLLATLQVNSLVSLERVCALWRSLFHTAGIERKQRFRHELSQWLGFLDDSNLTFLVTSIFGAPLAPISKTLADRLMVGMQLVNSPQSVMVFSEVAACLCPGLLAALLPIIPHFGDNHILAQSIVEILFDDSHLSSHPSAEFSAHEAVVMYLCNGGTAVFPEAFGSKARDTYRLDASCVRLVPPTGASRKRFRDLDSSDAAFEMLGRIACILREIDDETIRQEILRQARLLGTS